MNLELAIPWNINHYMSLNGFHAIYMPLISHCPAEITLYSWDFCQLQKELSRKPELIKAFKKTSHYYRSSAYEKLGDTATKQRDFFYNEAALQTEYLPGDIEILHTTAVPSLTRPFILHCEQFLPSLFPYAHQGASLTELPTEVKTYFKYLYESDLCLGIFSHLPETITSFSSFFESNTIDRKLHKSAIGILKPNTNNHFRNGKVTEKRFLFINSGNQNSNGFFLRGGHRVLRFWEKYISSGFSGKLIIRCRLPNDNLLTQYKVNVSFLKSQLNKTIFIEEDFITEHEMQILLSKSDFFLLPSDALHSASIMQALASGVIPVVSDTVGTDLYVNDNRNGIVISGIREDKWLLDETLQINMDSGKVSQDTEESIVHQLFNRITSINSNNGINQLRVNALNSFEAKFSGHNYANTFWDKVISLNSKSSCKRDAHHKVQFANSFTDPRHLKNLTEIPPQPVKYLETGNYGIYGRLGVFCKLLNGPDPISFSDWDLITASLNGNKKELSYSTEIIIKDNTVFFTAKKSKIHIWLYLSRVKNYYKFRLKLESFEDIELVEEDDSSEFNIIRYFHLYAKHKKSLGAFEADHSSVRLKLIKPKLNTADLKNNITLENGNQIYLSQFALTMHNKLKRFPYLHSKLKIAYLNFKELLIFNYLLFRFLRDKFIQKNSMDAKLVKEKSDHNIVKHYHIYYQYPKSLGPFTEANAKKRNVRRSIFIKRLDK